MNEETIGRIQINAEVLQQLSNVAFLLGVISIVQGEFAAVFWLGLVLLMMSAVGTLTNALIQSLPWQQFLERMAILGMMTGLLGMFQPWQINFYEYGFYILGISTLTFIIVSHIPSRPTE